MNKLQARAESLVNETTALLDQLVRLREKNGLTQEEVGWRMSVSQPTVAKFERYDANPTLSTIRRYAHAVGARLEIRVIDDTGWSSPVSRTVPLSGRETRSWGEWETSSQPPIVRELT